MPKLPAPPRPIGATVLILLLAVAALVVPVAALAAPPAGEPLPLTISPSPATFPKTTVGYQVGGEFQVSNEGGEEAQIEGVAIEGPEAGSFVLNGSNCGGPLFPGQHCTLWIGFAPGSAGAKQATVAIRVAGHAENSFEISGEAVPVQLSFQPGSYDFGLQYVNSGGASTSFQLTNSGEAAVQLNNLDIVGPDSNAFWTGNTDCWGRWLQPGESCAVQVSFGPRDTVSYTAAVRAGVNGQSFTAELTGTGGRPVVEVDANPVEFGTATAGGTGETRTVTLTNSGDLPAGFFIGVIAGGDAGSFRLLDENCSAAPLMPGATCAAHVRFTPADPGPKVARLAFFGEAEGGTMVELRGTGVAPAASLAPSSHDFGSQDKGTRSAAQTFVVRNDGAGALTLGAVSLLGADPDQFAISGDECTGATLAAGEQCTVRVRFAPQELGARAATLRIAGDATRPFTSALSGLGSAPVRAVSRRARARRRLIRNAELAAADARCPKRHRCRR